MPANVPAMKSLDWATATAAGKPKVKLTATIERMDERTSHGHGRAQGLPPIARHQEAFGGAAVTLRTSMATAVEDAADDVGPGFEHDVDTSIMPYEVKPEECVVEEVPATLTTAPVRWLWDRIPFRWEVLCFAIAAAVRYTHTMYQCR